MPLSKHDQKEITMKYEECAVHHVSGYPDIYTFFIRGNEYVELPMDANVRDPSEKSIPYKDMIITLEQNPHNFLLQNGGIKEEDILTDIGSGMLYGMRSHKQKQVIEHSKNILSISKMQSVDKDNVV